MGASPPNPNPNPKPSPVDETDEPSSWDLIIFAFFVCLLILTLIVMIFQEWQIKLPGFQLDSVSLNVDENNTTAVWDIGFSIDQSVGDLSVRLQIRARDYKGDYRVESVGMVGNSTVSVTTLMLEELTLEKVVFKFNSLNRIDNFMKAVCKDVAVVGFSPLPSTQGLVNVMKGGPRLCPVQ